MSSLQSFKLAPSSSVNLLHILDINNSGYIPYSLNIIFFICILFAISVIIIKNPISSILSLIALFFSIACYLILLGLTFIGLSYLLVYVGAVSILFLFILMLINVRISELTANTTNSIPLVLLVSIYFIYIFNKLLILDDTALSTLMYIYNNIIPFLDNRAHTEEQSIDYSSLVYYLEHHVYFVTSKSWDDNIIEATHIISIGNVLYTSYFIWLLITSIVLLLAMVGCIVITRKDTING